MRIISLQAENVKHLRAVEIVPDPDGSMVVISGRNAQGKSSVLDSIWFALGGGDALKDTTRPIRDGQTAAHVTVDLGDLKVTRRWTEKGTTLKVENSDGAVFKSPQTMLDKLVGRLSFDPLTFAGQDTKTQLDALLALVDLPFNPAELAAERVALFTERTDVNRGLKELDAQLAACGEPADGLPDDEVDPADLIDRITAAQHAADQITTARHCVQSGRSYVAELDAKLDCAREALAEHERIAAALEAKPAENIDALKDQLHNSQTLNARFRAEHARRELESRADQQREKAFCLTSLLLDLDARKHKAMTDAVMPVDGLAFTDDAVTYQGQPLKQCSTAEQLRVSIGMAMALNPTVRVIRITDGSLLDAENMTLIEDMAKTKDFQIWIERISDTGDVGIVIEDGQVANP